MTNPDATPTRRQVLRTGALGAAAAAFLAACGSDPQKAGQSGVPVASTSVPPTVAPLAASSTALELDQTVLRTGSSLELLAAEVYEKFGPEVEDADWRNAATRFAQDHTANAKIFTDAADKPLDEPNKVLRETFVDPVEDLLVGDKAILDFFRDLESTIAATYVTAAGTFTTAQWRAQISALASASARRIGVLGDGGEGQAPRAALFPLEDLISSTAYELNTPTTTTVAE